MKASRGSPLVLVGRVVLRMLAASAMFVVMGIPACGRSKSTAAGPRLAVNVGSVFIDEFKHLWILVTLSNPLSDSLWVNSRGLVNDPSGPPSTRELWFDVRDQSQRSMAFQCRIKVGQVSVRAYRVLEPRGTLDLPADLTCYELAAGTYTLTAFYRDGNPSVPPPPEGARHLRELLQSEPVKIVVPAGD